jgi:hypothetical protein
VLSVGNTKTTRLTSPFDKNGQRVIEAILQTDGDLVLYGPNNADGSAHPVWASHTDGNPLDYLVFGADGVWIYNANTPIWHNGKRV